MKRLPKQLVRKVEPKLESIKIGETVYIYAIDMEVTEKRECFLRPAVSYSRAPDFMHTLRVRRAKDGFHVTVLAKEDWKLDASRELVKDWLPVASIEIDYVPDFDMAAESDALAEQTTKLTTQREKRNRRAKGQNKAK